MVRLQICGGLVIWYLLQCSVPSEQLLNDRYAYNVRCKNRKRCQFTVAAYLLIKCFNSIRNVAWLQLDFVVRMTYDKSFEEPIVRRRVAKNTTWLPQGKPGRENGYHT